MKARVGRFAVAASLVLVTLPLAPARAGDLPGGRAARPAAGRTLDAPTDRELLRARRGGDTPLREPSSAGPPPPPRSPKPPPPPGRIRAEVRYCAVVATAGDLARVSVMLEVENGTKHSTEWRHVYAIRPDAEVIGARLDREGRESVAARTLTLDDARRLYAAVRAPPRPSRTRRRGRDPLRLERPARSRLAIHVWPLAPKETVRVHLTLVVPFGTVGKGAGPVRTFKPVVEDGAPTLTAIHDARPHEALVVRGGGLGTSVAVWRFDPSDVLRGAGLEPHADVTLRLVGTRGTTHRIAPHVFRATDAPGPVTASVRQHASTVRYAVEVVDETGTVRAVLGQTVPARRIDSDPAVTGTVTGWHRAALARRVLAWAGENPRRREEAMRYAVDLGVLVEGGTSALAVPRDALWRLERTERALYRRDGVPLGAQRREADGRSPPAGALGP